MKTVALVIQQSIVCLLSINGLLSGAEEPKLHEEQTEDFLDIYWPQNGDKLGNLEKFEVGSFTLVNLNDTNGDGIPDIGESDVVAMIPVEDEAAQKTVTVPARALLTAKASKGDTEINVALPKDVTSKVKGIGLNQVFPSLVNNFGIGQGQAATSAPNRIRIRQGNDKAELLYVSTTFDTRITLRTRLKQDYDIVSSEGEPTTIEIGEVDLMKLVVRRPAKSQDGKVTLKVEKGNIRLWDTEDKGKEAKLAGGSLAIEFGKEAKKGQSRVLWIEAITNSKATGKARDKAIADELTAQGVRGIVIRAEGNKGKITDAVRATGVWAIQTSFFNEGNTIGSQSQDLKEIFATRMNGVLGMGFFRAIPNMPVYAGGRMSMEFTLYPPKLQNEPVAVNIGRQVGAHTYAVRGGELFPVFSGDVETDIKMFTAIPTKGWNISEVVNDNSDSRDPVDMDLAKANNRVYRIDGPSTFTNVLDGDATHISNRFTALEFVRAKFGPGSKFTTPNYFVEGSRGSDLMPWHMVMYIKRWRAPIAKQEPITFGDIAKAKKEDSQAFLPDTDVVSASAPQFTGAAKGFAITVPRTADKTLEPGATTAGWILVFNGNTGRWGLTGRELKNGKVAAYARGDAGFNMKGGNWTVVAESVVGKAKVLEIVITDPDAKKGGVPFADKDRFVFGTFRTAAKDPKEAKRNQIETGGIDVFVEDSQFKSQQK